MNKKKKIIIKKKKKKIKIKWDAIAQKNKKKKIKTIRLLKIRKYLLIRIHVDRSKIWRIA
jgi:hypothetical protein